MPFVVVPVLAAMQQIYSLPRSPARFQAYLRLLQGTGEADLAVPVQHFNPMAKEAVADRLAELQRLEAEALAAQALAPLNSSALPGELLLQVALNLADDMHGGWTNRYTTDYANTFDLAAMQKRRFCTPLLWASEDFTPVLLRQRVQAQAWRSRYQQLHAAPTTLAEHLAQEVYVAKRLGAFGPPQPVAHAAYTRLLAARDQPTLLAFFYGDEAAVQLGHQPLGGLPPQAGFLLAQYVASF